MLSSIMKVSSKQPKGAVKGFFVIFVLLAVVRTAMPAADSPQSNISLILPAMYQEKPAATPTCQQLSNLSRPQIYLQLWYPVMYDRHKVTLTQSNRIIFLIMCPILLFLQILVIAMFTMYRQLLGQTGNIFYVLVFIQIGLNLHMFGSAIYHQIHGRDAMPDNFPNVCIGLATAQTLLEINHLSYLFLFLLYIVFLFRYSLKKKGNFFWIAIHGSMFIFCAIFTVIFYQFQFVGLNLFGICGFTLLYRSDQLINWDIITSCLELGLNFIFLFLGIFTYKYYKKHMPEWQQKLRKNKFSLIIKAFIVGFWLFLMGMGLSNFLLALICQREEIGIGFQAIATLGNVWKILQYYFTIFLIIINDRLRAKLKMMIKKVFLIKDKDRENKGQQQSSDKTVQMQQIFYNQKLLQMKDKNNQIDLLFISQIYTIISGVYAVFYQYYQKTLYQPQYPSPSLSPVSPIPPSPTETIPPTSNPSSSASLSLLPKFDPNPIKPINFKQSITIQLDSNTMKNYQFETRILLKIQILKCRLTFYAPKLFMKLLEFDQVSAVYESFRIADNVKKIWNVVDGQGGKSGEFFFFSEDRKYVLKTITVQEFVFLKQHLQVFYQYYKNNPNSLIAKIYGLFTIKGDEIQRTYRLILMKNITGCPKKQILRVYDLKGSKHNRQVVKQQKQQTQLNYLSDLTLKDLDFIRYESRLHISKQYIHSLRQALYQDTQFLKHLNLIDYSLLIIRVKWDTEPKDKGFWSNLQRIPHQKIRDQYYHIGVIDYLQLWDFQKKSQSWWKQFMGNKDISATNPTNYCVRFMGFVDQITGRWGQAKIRENEEMSQSQNERESWGNNRWTIRESQRTSKRTSKRKTRRGDKKQIQEMQEMQQIEEGNKMQQKIGVAIENKKNNYERELKQIFFENNEQEQQQYRRKFQNMSI